MKIKIFILVHLLMLPLSIFAEEIVIIGDKVNVRENPNKNSKIVKTVLIGETFTILEESSFFEIINVRKAKWYKISNSSFQGWVFGGYTSKYTELSIQELATIGRGVAKRNPNFAKELSIKIFSNPNIQLQYGPDSIMSHGEGKIIERIADCYLTGFKDFEISNKETLINNINNAVKTNDAKLLSTFGNCSMSAAICNSGVFLDITNSALSNVILGKIITHKLKLTTKSLDLEYLNGDKSLLFEIRKTDSNGWTWTGACFSANIFN
ncbi:SH3 domain-containing protein [Leptospira licerasiae]|uniref:SH3 domain-containing protein n=1 Tax=Leptospira licerasiae TaxID=447106 RepID=UPI0030167060